MVREFAWQTLSTCECDENATGKQSLNAEKNTGSTNKKQLDPETRLKQEKLKGSKDYKHKTRKQKCKPCVRFTRCDKCSWQQTRGMSKTERQKEFLGERGEIIASLSHFPDFNTKQTLKVWRSPLHSVFYWNVKGKTRKSERTPPVSWRPWALAYSAIDRTTFHACQRCRKTTVFAVFFSAFGCHLASKSLSWPAMPVSIKKQEFELRKRIKLFDDF